MSKHPRFTTKELERLEDAGHLQECPVSRIRSLEGVPHGVCICGYWDAISKVSSALDARGNWRVALEAEPRREEESKAARVEHIAYAMALAAKGTPLMDRRSELNEWAVMLREALSDRKDV